MQIVRKLEELRPSRPRRRGLVPTMGAFHDGHLSLMRTARAECEEVVVSLFVNPLQFGPTEDLSRYPRNEEADAAMAEAAGVDILFAPSPETILGYHRATVKTQGISDRYEGAYRPGHFDGVATIVAKLFNIAYSEIAYFGLKDRQQCAVIEAMVADLNFPIQLSFQKTVREPDGLALSSRNVYLSPQERSIAPNLHATLKLAAEKISYRESVPKVLNESSTNLAALGFDVAYFDLVDTRTFQPIVTPQAHAVIVTAAKLGKTRLIDNVDVPLCG